MWKVQMLRLQLGLTKLRPDRSEFSEDLRRLVLILMWIKSPENWTVPTCSGNCARTGQWTLSSNYHILNGVRDEMSSWDQPLKEMILTLYHLPTILCTTSALSLYPIFQNSKWQSDNNFRICLHLPCTVGSFFFQLLVKCTRKPWNGGYHWALALPS